MATKKTTNKSKTPANNAAGNVIVEGPGLGPEQMKTAVAAAVKNAAGEVKNMIAREMDRLDELPDRGRANDYFCTGELPDLPGRENETIGNAADVFAASGYWPDLTPAKIAVQIMAGRSLGLEPAQAMFDLKIEPGNEGPTISYRTRQSYIETSDRIEGMRHGRADGSNDDHKTPDPALPTAETKSNVVPIGGKGCPRCGSPKPNLHPAVQFEGEVSPCSDPFHGEFADLANKGDLSDRAAEPSPTPGPDPETTSAAGSDASAAAINDEGPTLKETTAKMATKPADPDPAEPAADPFATPAVDPGPSAGDVGDDTAAVMQSWRTRIAQICDELGFDKKEKEKRLVDFDGRNPAKRRDQFEAAENYYNGQVAGKRKIVLEALAEGGRKTNDDCRGFFIYAEVPQDPDSWTYADAVKAETAFAAFSNVK